MIQKKCFDSIIPEKFMHGSVKIPAVVDYVSIFW